MVVMMTVFVMRWFCQVVIICHVHLQEGRRRQRTCLAVTMCITSSGFCDSCNLTTDTLMNSWLCVLNWKKCRLGRCHVCMHSLHSMSIVRFVYSLQSCSVAATTVWNSLPKYLCTENVVMDRSLAIWRYFCLHGLAYLSEAPLRERLFNRCFTNIPTYLVIYLVDALICSLCVLLVQRTHKLLGLFVNVETGLTCVINKASVGLLRPCDIVERLYLDPALEPRCVEDCLADSPAINAGNDWSTGDKCDEETDTGTCHCRRYLVLNKCCKNSFLLTSTCIVTLLWYGVSVASKCMQCWKLWFWSVVGL